VVEVHYCVAAAIWPIIITPLVLYLHRSQVLKLTTSRTITVYYNLQINSLIRFMVYHILLARIYLLSLCLSVCLYL
jgi:hypothetical protein